MAILPNPGNQQIPVEEYQPASTTSGEDRRATQYLKLQQPKPITIQQYRERQQKIAEEKLTRIPPTQKPKHRRGGRIVRLRRRLAELKGRVNADPPPPWQEGRHLWLQISKIEAELHKDTPKTTQPPTL